MFVDQTTKMFDPTCGSGSSLRAAESMGAEHVLGLERDPEHFESATSAYRKFRILKS
jgi:predicted RNA methylase